jgi:tetratricopeptide (TPR) repeat protein
VVTRGGVHDNPDMHTKIVFAAALLTLSSAVFAVPDSSGQVTSTPAPDIAGDAAMSARLNYNVGFELFEKAQAAEKEAATLKGAKAKSAREAVMVGYGSARSRFEEAAKADPNIKEAWNLIGYTSRRLGEYDKALVAYDKALALNAKYPEALEYRAEAYLALNRLDDAKSGYLALVAASPAQATVLLASMRAWIDERRKSPAGVATTDLDAFEIWVRERTAASRQTAAMRPDASFRGWN